MRRSFLWVSLSIAAIGCGGSVDVGSGGAGTTSAGTNSGPSTTSTNATTGAGGAGTSTSATNGTTGTGGDMYLNCPQTLPNGGPCAMEGLACSYGDEIAPACRSVVVCTMGSWVAQPGDFCNPAVCPAQIPAAKTACNSLGAQCGYPDGTICDCNQCEGGGFCMPMATLQWFCDAPPSNPGCPIIAPNEGVVCSTPMTCSYPPACISPEVICQNGAWIWQPIACGG